VRQTATAKFTAGRTVWDRRQIGSQESAVLAGALHDIGRARAHALRLRLEPLSLQQVVVLSPDAARYGA
jgi:ABC-2 type transport system ATP-binding protein